VLFDGIPILAPLVGLFALAEIFRLSSIDRKTVVPDTVEMSGNRLNGLKEVYKHKWLWLRCSIIGLIIGAVPGAGGASSSFIAYGHAVQSAKEKTGFGEGRIEGVIASEAANDAKDGGQLFPSMALGIPGSASMAVFLAGLLAHGMFPGPRTLIDNMELVMVVALSLGTANIMTSVIGFSLINQFTRLLKIPIQRLLPAITVLALTAAYLGRNQYADVIMTFVFALLGAVLIYVGVSRVPFLIAFVLGSLLEQNFYFASQFARGDLYQAFFTGTLNLVLIAIVLFSIIAIALPKRYTRRIMRGLGGLRP
jgi:putative tricarboxylic transport membrane protein